MKRRQAHIEVSDHAALRWLEREHGLDVAAVKSVIAGKALNGAQLGAVSVSIDKVKLVLRDTRDGAVGDVTVVTVLTRDSSIGESGR